MDPNGNGYVEQPEFEKYLEMYGIKIDKERCGYLFSLIQSHNAELEDGGSSHNGNIVLPYFGHLFVLRKSNIDGAFSRSCVGSKIFF